MASMISSQGNKHLFRNNSYESHGYQVSESYMETESHQNSARGSIVTTASDDSSCSSCIKQSDDPLSYPRSRKFNFSSPDHTIQQSITYGGQNVDCGELEGSNAGLRPQSYVMNDSAKMRYPQYEDEVVRFQTFRNWPARYHQSPHQLAEAGFFYTNFMDWVKCFCCGTELKNWKPTDDPMRKHAQLSPRCQFLIFVKGEEFIVAAQHSWNTYLEHDAYIPVAYNETPTGRSERISEITRNSSAISDIPTSSGEKSESYPEWTLEKNPLLTDAAQAVIQMGYMPKHVKDAVEEVLGHKAWDLMTSSDIIAMLSKHGRSTVNNPASSTTTTTTTTTTTAQRTQDKECSLGTDIPSLESENIALRDRKLCKVCCEENVSIVFLPCAHLVCCAQCAPAIQNCAVCRKVVKGTVRVSF